MGTESKGRAWFGKIYNKLETILVEVDTFTSQVHLFSLGFNIVVDYHILILSSECFGEY